MGVDGENLTLIEVSRLLRDLHVISDILNQCSDYTLQSNNELLIAKLKNSLSFIKLYLNSKLNNVCTKHSTNSNQMVEEDCTHCVQENASSEEIQQVRLDYDVADGIEEYETVAGKASRGDAKRELAASQFTSCHCKVEKYLNRIGFGEIRPHRVNI